MNNLTEELRKLAEAWPKDSEWKASLSDDCFWFDRKGECQGLDYESDDKDNAAARTIIEDLLIDMGYSFIQYCAPNNRREEWVLFANKFLGQKVTGKGPTRTAALVKVANAILAVRSIEVSNG